MNFQTHKDCYSVEYYFFLSTFIRSSARHFDVILILSPSDLLWHRFRAKLCREWSHAYRAHCDSGGL